MEAKILLYDAGNNKIGETFMRRARQLVKGQRAVWVDESQTAIRFMADVDDWEAIPYSEAAADEAIVVLAQKRIKQRKLMIAHLIAFVPGFFLLYILSLAVADITWYRDGLMFGGFVFGSWTTLFVVHMIYIYQTMYKIGGRTTSKEERRARELATEIAALKAKM